MLLLQQLKEDTLPEDWQGPELTAEGPIPLYSMTRKSTTGRSDAMKFWFPVIGIITSLVLLALGYYLTEYAAQAGALTADEDVFLSVYTLVGKLSYFYSAIFSLFSIAVFLWSSIRKRPLMTGGRSSLTDLKELPWKEFREYVMSLFQKLDYSPDAKRTLDEEDSDLRLKRSGRTSLVCCRKYYVRKIPLSMVREFYAAMLREPALEKGYFITTGSFSYAARKFASDKPLTLIDGERLMDFARIAESIDAAKERSSLQNDLNKMGYTCPVCGAHMLLRTVENNSHSVTQFWGCSAYPACKGALRKEQEDLVPFGY